MAMFGFFKKILVENWFISSMLSGESHTLLKTFTKSLLWLVVRAKEIMLVILNYKLCILNMIFGIILLACVFFHYLNQQKHRAIIEQRQRQRREENQVAAKRRPGAAARQHEVFRNILNRARVMIRFR